MDPAITAAARELLASHIRLRIAQDSLEDGSLDNPYYHDQAFQVEQMCVAFQEQAHEFAVKCPSVHIEARSKVA